MKRSTKQRNNIKIIKNKEIIIYKNGKKFKHFKRSETKKLNENEMYILDYLLNKYIGDEVDIDSDYSENNISNDNKDFEINSNDQLSESKIKSKRKIRTNEAENEIDIDSNEEEKIASKGIKIKGKNNKKNIDHLNKKEEDAEEEDDMLNAGISNISNEEEEEDKEEENLESNRVKQSKGRKDSEQSDESDEVREEKIKKRIIKSYKNPCNKVTKGSITRVTHGDVVEIKHIKKQSKTVQTKKQPSQIKKEKNSTTRYEPEEIPDIEVQEKIQYKKHENIPQYISQLQSYTSPTIKFVNEYKAEQSVLNGIPSSALINSREIKGILFLDKNNFLCFISAESDNIEIDISLEDIKKIYFNVKGSINLKNYTKKTEEEKFIQIIEINNKINDFKFNNEEDFEFLIKGLIQIYKNKTVGVDKNLISHIVRNIVKRNSQGTEISENHRNNNIELSNTYNNIREIDNNYYNEDNAENKESNYFEKNNEVNYNKNNENEQGNENDEDDIIITTTITEVFKDGELINKETREKKDGVMKSLHVYSPDKDEYEKFLINTKLGKNQMIKRYKDGLPIEGNNNDYSNNNFEIDNINNDEDN